MTFYATHSIGWVARPPHDSFPGGFKRAGAFKKASNMNYALDLSLKLEKHLAALQQQQLPNQRQRRWSIGHASSHGHGFSNGHGNGNGNGSHPGTPDDTPDPDSDLEERALTLAIDEMSAESGGHTPWAANGKAVRIGQIVLLVDSDTVVPEDCLRDAAREMAACPTVAIIQHSSDIMQIANHYFENAFAYFTRRINRCISMGACLWSRSVFYWCSDDLKISACANGEIAPFMGHNASVFLSAGVGQSSQPLLRFLRWSALQDAAFMDPADGRQKIWSESNVSEDFDMSLRLQMHGYIIRCVRMAYSHLMS
jgi:hypothetical protein